MTATASPFYVQALWYAFGRNDAAEWFHHVDAHAFATWYVAQTTNSYRPSIQDAFKAYVSQLATPPTQTGPTS